MSTSPSTAITRLDLSTPYTEFDVLMNRKKYIGHKIFRQRSVGIQAADVLKLKLESLLQQASTKRAPGGGYTRTRGDFTKFAYSCQPYGLEEPIDDWQSQVYGDLINSESLGALRVVNGICDEYERDCANALYDTSVWTGSDLSTALTYEWSDVDNATPVADIQAAKLKVEAGSGLEANALVCNSVQFFDLCNTGEILDRVSLTKTPTQTTLAGIVAEMLGLQYIMVAGGLTNSANPQQARSISRIWSSEYAMVCRVSESDDPQDPCVGRTFIWSGWGGASGTGEEIAVAVDQYREEAIEGTVIRGRNNRDIVVMYPQAGHLLSNVKA